MNRKSIAIFFFAVLMVSIITPVSYSQQDRFQPTLPHNSVLRFIKAKTLREQGKIQDAIKELNSINLKNPGYYLSWYNLGLAYYNLNDYVKAEDAFKRALDIRDKENIPDAMIYNSLGVLYIKKVEYTNAEKYLKLGELHADWLNSDQKQKLYNNLGVLYAFKGNESESNRYFSFAAKQLNYTPAQDNLRRLESIKSSVKKQKK